jgi:hypothetical protein
LDDKLFDGLLIGAFSVIVLLLVVTALYLGYQTGPG